MLVRPMTDCPLSSVGKTEVYKPQGNVFKIMAVAFVLGHNF